MFTDDEVSLIQRLRRSCFSMETWVNALSANDIFQALDGRDVSLSARSWHVEVYSVFEQQGTRWIQLLLKGPDEYSVAVRVGPRDTVTEILEALSSWFADPSASGGRVRDLG